MPGIGNYRDPAEHKVLIAQGAAWACLLWIRLHYGKHFKAPLGFYRADFSRVLKDQLRATGLLTLISYLIPALPQVYTPANRPDIRISSFVWAKGCGPSRRERFVFMPVIDERGLQQPGLCFFRTRTNCENEKKATVRGWHKYLPSTAGRCSARVILSSSKGWGQADVKHALILQLVILTLCPVAPWALSYLLFMPEPFHNCDICSCITKYHIQKSKYVPCPENVSNWASVFANKLTYKSKAGGAPCILEEKMTTTNLSLISMIHFISSLQKRSQRH